VMISLSTGYKCPVTKRTKWRMRRHVRSNQKMAQFDHYGYSMTFAPALCHRRSVLVTCYRARFFCKI
jgi:hypothetical protein